jgi:hypothetical protein
MVGVPILPLKAVAVAHKLAREAGEGAVAIGIVPGDPIDLEKNTWDRGDIQVVTRDAVLTAKVPEGRFPDFREVIPTARPECEVRLADARAFGRLLGTIAAGTDSEAKAVEIVAAGGCVMMSAESATKGRTQVALVAPDMDGRATFEMDAAWFRQFFGVIGDSPLVLRWFGPKDPILAKVGPYYDFVQMPLTRETRSEPAPAPDSEHGGDSPAAEPEPGIDGGDEPGDDGDSPAAGSEPGSAATVAESPRPHKGNRKARRRPSKNGRAH